MSPLTPYPQIVQQNIQISQPVDNVGARVSQISVDGFVLRTIK